MYNFKYDGGQFRLHISNEKYYVNEKKRTVTVVAMVEVAVPEFILRTVDYTQMPNGFTADSMFPFGGVYGCQPVKMTWTARCSQDDEWDVEKGKKIALCKLEANAYRRFGKSLAIWLDKFSRFAGVLLRTGYVFVDKSVRAAEHDERYINSIAR